MNSFKILSSALLAAAAFAAFASTDEQQIRNVYSKLSGAMLSKSVTRVKALEGPGFTDTEHGQTMDAAKANSMMAQEFKAVRAFTECNIRVTSIRVAGKTAVARTSYVMAANLVMQGKKHKFHVTGDSEDHLVKTSRGWLFSATKDTSEHATLDGKAVPNQ